jgi:ATP-dependent DNA ligase
MPHTAFFTIIGYEYVDSKYVVALVDNKILKKVGTFKEGLSEKENKALLETLLSNKISDEKNYLEVPPGICVELE